MPLSGLELEAWRRFANAALAESAVGKRAAMRDGGGYGDEWKRYVDDSDKTEVSIDVARRVIRILEAGPKTAAAVARIRRSPEFESWVSARWLPEWDERDRDADIVQAAADRAYDRLDDAPPIGIAAGDEAGIAAFVARALVGKNAISAASAPRVAAALAEIFDEQGSEMRRSLLETYDPRFWSEWPSRSERE